MRIGRNEIIEELTEHIRQSGGEPGEWRVGTAKDATIIGKLPIQDENPASMAGLAYREAFTTYAADDAVDYLVNAFGLHPDCDSAPRPGKIVFVYRAGKEAISHQLSAVSKGGTPLGSY